MAALLTAPWSAASGVFDLLGPGPAASPLSVAFFQVGLLANACLIWDHLAPPRMHRHSDAEGVTVVVGSRLSRLRAVWNPVAAGILIAAEAGLVLLVALGLRNGKSGISGSLPDPAHLVSVLGPSVGTAGIGFAVYVILHRGWRRAFPGALLLALSVVSLRGEWLTEAGRRLAVVLRWI